MIKGKAGYDEAMESYYNALTTKDVISYGKEMDQINALLELPRHPLIHEVPSLGRFAVFILLSALDGRALKRSNDVLIEIQKQRARKRRKSRKPEEKKLVQQCWNEWQQNPKLYRNPADFISKMLIRTGINQKGTVENWISEFKAEYAKELGLTG